jgi:serine/threonine protein kinase
MIPVTCANCGLRVLVPPTVQGRAGVCFGCGAPVHVPAQQNPAQLQELDFSRGTRVADRYVIGELIGKGGMGVVYRAHDSLVDEEVALKFMNPRMLRTQKGQQLFIKEAQLARRLRHDNIVSVHDVSTTPEGILYLSMEYLNGVSLRAYLRKRRQDRKHVNVRLAIEITLQMLSALEYAHRIVVHRDLKPENVMLLPGEHVKVLDFGLAVAVEEEQEAANVDPSKPRKVVGTAFYAAPEQRKHEKIDFRTDLYTVGLMLHELLTLRTPIDEAVNIVDVRNDVAPSILDIHQKAVQPNRDLRWQSARDFRKALSAAYNEAYRRVQVMEVRTESGQTLSTESMVYFEGGGFLMGSDEVLEESPEFETTVEPFYLDKYPVTVEEYETFVRATNRPEPKFLRDPEFNGPRQPITGVTLEDALAYAQWIGKTLPTEAQWEFAARGRENRKYPWGNLEPDTNRANFGDYLGMPSIVTMHESGATPEGMHDLAGNVYEWTLDAFVPYSTYRDGRPAETTEPRRVVRGGSWHSPPNELRTTYRKGLFPESQLATVGFRCAVAASEVHRRA